MAVQGTCDQKFQEVRQEFERNFAARGEVGASVCVTVGGQTVVDLWGGTANTETDTPWTDETVSIVFSSTKGATAICAHVLASHGQLDLDAPVASYWPEFAQAGKENIQVKMLLNHQAGLAGGTRSSATRGLCGLGPDGQRAGQRGTLLGARHPQRLSCPHLWLADR